MKPSRINSLRMIWKRMNASILTPSQSRSLRKKHNNNVYFWIWITKSKVNKACQPAKKVNFNRFISDYCVLFLFLWTLDLLDLEGLEVRKKCVVIRKKVIIHWQRDFVIKLGPSLPRAAWLISASANVISENYAELQKN